MNDCFIVLSAPCLLKNCLSAKEVSKFIINGTLQSIEFFRENYQKKFNIQIISKPVADGDGVLDCIASNFYQSLVSGPFGQPVLAKWGSYHDTAVVEMSQASGLALIKDEYQYDALTTSSYGTGQLLSKAIEQGFKKILLTIGGSSTNDGGIGALMALGVKFYDKNQNIIFGQGNKACGKIKSIDISSFKNLLRGIDLSIICDVENSLLGQTGASFIFGPQKLSPNNRNNSLILAEMDHNLSILNEAIIRTVKKDFSKEKGSGAAGGIGIGFRAFGQAKFVKGADFILDFIHFDKVQSDFVFTSEGFCDKSTLMGKAPYAVCKRKKDSFVSILTGGIESLDVAKSLYQAGTKSISIFADRPLTTEESIKNASKLIEAAAFHEIFSYLCSHKLRL
jgi:glycerate kinase